MESNIKVSVIIPTYNVAEFLPSAINSVLDQTLQDREIIIVDDGSTDNTKDLLIKITDRFQYIYQENQGVATARNAGIKRASGEFLVFLDADDLLLPTKLELQSGYLVDHPECGVVFSNVTCFEIDNKGNERRWPYPVNSALWASVNNPNRLNELLIIQNIVPPISAMVRRDLIIQIDGFDENRELMSVEDWDLWYRLAQICEFGYLDENVALYRVMDTSLSRNKARRIRASTALQSKFENSRGYQRLSDKARASFHFSWGNVFLDNHNRISALEHYRRAIGYNSYHVLAWFAFLMTTLIGDNAVVFYRFKKKLDGSFR